MLLGVWMGETIAELQPHLAIVGVFHDGAGV